MVAQGAVDERGLRPTVVRLRNGKIDKVEVGLGIRDAADETVEITSGLAPGDTVLLATNVKRPSVGIIIALWEVRKPITDSQKKTGSFA